jgi:hypothetical protein
MTEMDTPCCERMAVDLQHKCDVHSDRFECPDAFISSTRGGYGLMIHDGGHSVIEISFCPWCGSKLPPIKRSLIVDDGEDIDDDEEDED